MVPVLCRYSSYFPRLVAWLHDDVAAHFSPAVPLGLEVHVNSSGTVTTQARTYATTTGRPRCRRRRAPSEDSSILTAADNSQQTTVLSWRASSSRQTADSRDGPGSETTILSETGMLTAPLV
ncbi:hypothetical protein BaRGS_00000425 [Batillaria attramentaria]|uniref:Uncharacterized protein n=1 Tax=Batillaria attramentaria TaxID=370345 RepID=A0ABD0M9W4_9CAEN